MIQGHSDLYKQFKYSQSYIVKQLQKKKNQKTFNKQVDKVTAKQPVINTESSELPARSMLCPVVSCGLLQSQV